MIGKILSDRYKIIEQIGTGGMSIVYKAERLKDGKLFALKVLREEFKNNEQYLDLFFKEAQTGAALSHTNITKIYTMYTDNDIHYLVMEYVGGETLKEMIQRLGPLDYKFALEIAIQISGALKYAHSKGFVHKDIKPQNILITPQGVAKLTDFGIAGSGDIDRFGENNAVLGSVHYFAPEQASGKMTSNKTDIYSLGIVLYEMLTGELPFQGDTTTTVAIKHMHEDLVRPSQKSEDHIPSSVDEIVYKATQKDDKMRYDSASDLQADLERALHDPYGDFVKQKKDKLKYKPIGETGEFRAKAHFGIRFLPLVIMVLVVFGLLAFLVLYNISPQKEEAVPHGYVTVPELMSLMEAEAVTKLTESGLNYEITYDDTSKVEHGIVISQLPVSGKRIDRNETVKFTVSGKENAKELPNFVGMDISEVETMLNELKLKASNEYRTGNGNEIDGMVLEQSPAPNTKYLEGDNIKLIIKRSETKTEAIQDVSNKKLDEAVSTLRSFGFSNIRIIKEDDKKQQGLVIRQSPAAGTMENTSIRVSLWIATDLKKEKTQDMDIAIPVTEDASKIEITMLDSDGLEYAVTEAQLDKGTHNIRITISSLLEGVKEIRTYRDGVLKEHMAFEFEE